MQWTSWECRMGHEMGGSGKILQGKDLAPAHFSRLGGWEGVGKAAQARHQRKVLTPCFAVRSLGRTLPILYLSLYSTFLVPSSDVHLKIVLLTFYRLKYMAK